MSSYLEIWTEFGLSKTNVYFGTEAYLYNHRFAL